MNFFGAGPGEFLLVLVVAFLVLGPEQMPQMARKAGRMLREFRMQTDEVTRDFRAALSEVGEVANSTIGDVTQAVAWDTPPGNGAHPPAAPLPPPAVVAAPPTPPVSVTPVTCEGCGMVTDSSMRYCPRCGLRLPSAAGPA